MKRVYQYKEQRQLIVGEIYNFRVVKQVKLPDNEQFYILEDPFGERHLLPEKYYRAYHLTVNEFYPCHVDKVNCQGRIFLEPRHPFFVPGQFYEFKFVRTETYINKKGQKISMNLMKSRNDQTAYLDIKAGINDSKLMAWTKYRIDKIKKSMVFLATE